MPFCGSCGHDNAAGLKFCGKCGTALPETTEEEADASSQQPPTTTAATDEIGADDSGLVNWISPESLIGAGEAYKPRTKKDYQNYWCIVLLVSVSIAVGAILGCSVCD